jgi:addiction module RelE/StbE family toxin
MEVVLSDRFQRSLKKFFKKHPELTDAFWKKLEMFQTNPFDRSLKTHSLSGTLEGLRSFSITHEYRVLFRFTEEGNALLSAIGDHDHLY